MDNGLHFGIFLQQAPFGGVTYFSWLLDGLWVTTALFLCAGTFAFLVGSLFGILRTTPSAVLRGIGTAYVAVFRNIPLIVQFFV